MSARLSDVEALAGVLYEHRQGALACYDHPPTPEHPGWCCVCGAHDLMVSWRSHVAEHLAARLAEAEQVTRERDEARAELAAAREALARVEAVCEQVERDNEDHINHCGQHLYGSVVTVAEYVRAALAQPATDECRCQIVGWSRDPGEPHIPAQPEWEQADDCPIHPLATDSARPECSQCDVLEAEVVEYGMCASCLHDARRSGWEPGGEPPC